MVKCRFIFASLGIVALALSVAGCTTIQTDAGVQAISTDAHIRIASGELAGVSADGVFSFKGIPYAAPPVGPLRWRAPQSAASWAGVRAATQYGNDCMQNPFLTDAAAGPPRRKSEDCLYLNVWAPRGPRTALPVMVWIYGGGLTIGSGAVTDPTELARKGVIVVTFNYRLGRFGFFAHPALIKEHPSEPVGNYGLMDQIAALRWVRDNIAAFGGDPANLTIFGESSGGSSVMHLMVADDARGLFQRAIVESGGGRDHWTPLTADTAQRHSALADGIAFAKRAGVTNDDPAALRAIPASVVQGQVYFWAQEPDYSGAMVDGRIVPEDLDAAFAHGRETHVPLLIGTNDDELGEVPKPVLDHQIGQVYAKAGANAARLSAFYGPGKSRPADLISDIGFVEPARFIAASHVANGAPAWLYRFSYVPASKRTPNSGAHHATEIVYVFGTVKSGSAKTTEADRHMSDAVEDYWVRFAKSGNPNGSGRPNWPAYSAASDMIMDFSNDGPHFIRRPDKARIGVIASHY